MTAGTLEIGIKIRSPGWGPLSRQMARPTPEIERRERSRAQGS